MCLKVKMVEQKHRIEFCLGDGLVCVCGGGGGGGATRAKQHL